ncbi:thy-1 membrane glycoprotein [Oreochromis aureus]|uniref:Ig-like domain-containing protein n=1 Tax=Oreochromis aureus TaxID=47969 RepID=A0A668T8N9_OREAU|nr:thy-1 membrane glycoprotein [Oreochromis aureus]XP_039473851.1 thy-1 membrane glycoprotein [Oreochromis aureus]
MLKSLFVYGVLGVMLIPVKSQLMTVCMEEDEELRVDCLIENKPNIINTYQFSWSIGVRQEIINTNVSSGPATHRSLLINKSRVEELEPVGYRMTLSDFRDKLSDNTTFLCNISGQDANISVQKDNILSCSAVSLLLKNSWSWMVCLLLFFYHTHS